MRELEADLDRLEEAIRQLFQTMKRPGTWTTITSRAGVRIDRPSAGILHLLMAHEQAHCHLHDIAEQLGVEAPSVTRKTQELERAGLIRRRRGESDRRAVELAVTPRGRAISKRLWQARRDSSARVLSTWPEQDRKQFIDLLERYILDLVEDYQTVKPQKIR